MSAFVCPPCQSIVCGEVHTVHSICIFMYSVEVFLYKNVPQRALPGGEKKNSQPGLNQFNPARLGPC